ncbi:SCO family protein [Flavobacteriaceae bacterium]|jgi:protein SCO1/2|nr:SCO family protein [Flavobacteriaceae bacterium]MDB9913759.1 SCO family protein [Flavobacteriaceae bacterium]MDB9994373.1 SCO family protein [Flavobacteriaceae bacterium]|tara:strand:+ start:1042 stop:1662 length:621 start_codon:yes stop_codon:yes gene_type:complete
MKNYSYIGISFVILVFGIWAVPKIVDRFTKPRLAKIGKVPEFSFTNQNQKTITNQSYHDKVYIVEFFFTTCPSICPIMNQNMVKIQDHFFGNPNLGIASLTIDPIKDTPKVLKEYAIQYKITNPNWNLLTGNKETIYKFANSGFNLYVGENPEVGGGFEHSGFFALVDKEGNIRSRFDEQGNPIIYYNGLGDDGVKMLKEDIKLLL